MKIAYIDCFSGVAGDMLLAALLDAGAPLKEVVAGLRSIASIRDEWDIGVEQVTRGMGSIAAAHVNVSSKYQHRPTGPPSSSPPTNGGRGNDHSHSQGHSHSHSHGHGHSHSHAHEDGGDGNAEHSQGCQNLPEGAVAPTAGGASEDVQHDPVRNLSAIGEMLTESGLPEVVKQRSIQVFTALGHAEAKTHGSTLDQVHFHEVGAIDSIIDTVGVVLALHLLGVEKVYCSALPLSEGTVWTAHGILPVPAPATLRLMMGIPTCPGPKSAKGELVTPTGAALVRVLASDYGRPPLFVPQTIGIGAGTKNFDKHPNILRVILGDVAAPPAALEPSPLAELAAPATGGEGGDWNTRQLWILEANIDDMTGEAAGYLTEKMLEEGCLDAWVSPIVMKKSRPAFTVHVLCDPQDQERFMRLLFVDSTTIGVRRRSMERCALRRTTATVGTSFGDVRVKVAWLDGVAVNVKPEYEDCKALATAARVPLPAVTDQARATASATIAELADVQ